MSKMLKYSLLFAIATLVSRGFGLIRDVVLAHEFGAGYEFDAYVIAISFPFLLRRSFAEGAMTSAFLPLYNEKGKSNEFASAVITSLGLIALILTICVELFPQIVPTMFSSGASENTVLLASKLVRITMPFLIAIFLWSVLYGILNSHGKFFLAALSPVMMNIGIITFTLLLKNIKEPIFGPAIGFVTGGIMMFLLLLPVALKIGFRYKPTLKGIGEFFSLFIPAFLTMALSQINTVVDINVASFLKAGSVSVMQYANRLYQLPFGIFGIAMSTVVLPVLVNERSKYQEHLSEGVMLSLFLTVPAAVGLGVISKPLVSLIYEHGAFTATDTALTGNVLLFYALGLPFYSTTAVLSRAYHAKKNMRTPFRATLISVSLNVALDVVFARLIGVAGIALATSVAGVTSTFYLWKISPTFDLKRFSKIICASTLMGIIVAAINSLHASRLWTLLMVCLGALSYLAFCRMFHLEEVQQIKKIFRK